MPPRVWAAHICTASSLSICPSESAGLLERGLKDPSAPPVGDADEAMALTMIARPSGRCMGRGTDARACLRQPSASAVADAPRGAAPP
jgi:hypothetical protein